MNCRPGSKDLVTQSDKLHAARMAAYRYRPGDEDAVQDAFLAVLQHEKKGREGNFSYWFTVATHYLNDRARSDARRVRREEEYAVRTYGYNAVFNHTPENVDGDDN